jgi:hypothetical protein
MLQLSKTMPVQGDPTGYAGKSKLAVKTISVLPEKLKKVLALLLLL